MVGEEEERKEERESVTAYIPLSDELLQLLNEREERVKLVLLYKRGSEI